MKYLLDTHVWLFAIDDPKLLSSKVRRILEDERNEFHLSIASVWEIAIKIAGNKLALGITEDLDVFVTRVNKSSGIKFLPISVKEACAVCELPWHHRDPFDRILVAQAEANGLTILSKDPNLKNYVPNVVW